MFLYVHPIYLPDEKQFERHVQQLGELLMDWVNIQKREFCEANIFEKKRIIVTLERILEDQLCCFLSRKY